MRTIFMFIITIAIITLEVTASAQPSAESLYTEGQSAYDRADYKSAVVKWQAAYTLSKETDLLFNIAQALRLSGDCPAALSTYLRFIALDADAASEQHKLAEDLARELDRMCSITPSVMTGQTSTEREPDVGSELNLIPHLNTSESETVQPGKKWKIAGLTAGGIGTVAIAVGLYLGHQGQAIGEEVTAACSVSCDWSAWKDRDAKGQRYVSIGRGLDVGGAIGVASGAVLYYLGVRQGALTIMPRASEGGGAVSWSGTW